MMVSPAEAASEIWKYSWVKFLNCPPPPPRRLHEAEADRSHPGLRHARDGGPVDLARLARAEGFGQAAGDALGAGEQQDARGVLVETMNEGGLLRPAELQRLGQRVDMAVALPAAALAGQARGLVQSDQGLSLPEDVLSPESDPLAGVLRVCLYPLPFVNRRRGLGDALVLYEDAAPVDEVLCRSDAEALHVVGHAAGQAKAGVGGGYAEANERGAKDVLFLHGLFFFSSLVETVPSCGR